MTKALIAVGSDTIVITNNNHFSKKLPIQLSTT